MAPDVESSGLAQDALEVQKSREGGSHAQGSQAVVLGLNSLKRLAVEFLHVGFADWDRQMGWQEARDRP